MLQILNRSFVRLMFKETILVRYKGTWAATYGCNHLELYKQLAYRRHLLLTKTPKFAKSFSTSDRCQASQLNAKCWKCGRKIDQDKEQFMCFCGVLQAPDANRNCFQVLGLEISFDIDTKVLSKRLKELQKILHPDKFSQKSTEEKVHSEQHSAVVNKAFDTLSKPLLRGLYILSLYGESIEEGHMEMDQVFLMDIMDINERLAEVASLNDLEEFKKENEAKRKELIQQLNLAFKEEDIKHAKSILQMLQYFANIEEKIKAIRLTLL